jgi:hypothetical protein
MALDGHPAPPIDYDAADEVATGDDTEDDEGNRLTRTEDATGETTEYGSVAGGRPCFRFSAPMSFRSPRPFDANGWICHRAAEPGGRGVTVSENRKQGLTLAKASPARADPGEGLA